MDAILDCLFEEKDWIFSGIGIFVIGLFVYKSANVSEVKADVEKNLLH